MRLPSRQRIRNTIDTVLRDFVKKQLGLLRSAFLVGGHQHHGGDAWTPREGEYPHPQLLETGRLRDSIQTRVWRGEAVIETALPYAKFVHEGTREMPPRPIVIMTEQDKNRLVVQMKTRLEGLMRGRA